MLRSLSCRSNLLLLEDTINLYRVYPVELRHKRFNLDTLDTTILLKMLVEELTSLCKHPHLELRVLVNIRNIITLLNHRRININYGRIIYHAIKYEFPRIVRIATVIPLTLSHVHVVELIQSHYDEVALWVLQTGTIKLRTGHILYVAMQHKCVNIVRYLLSHDIINNIWVYDVRHNALFIAIKMMPQIVPYILSLPHLIVYPDAYISQAIYRGANVNLLRLLLYHPKIRRSVYGNDIRIALEKAQTLKLHAHVHCLQRI